MAASLDLIPFPKSFESSAPQQEGTWRLILGISARKDFSAFLKMRNYVKLNFKKGDAVIFTTHQVRTLVCLGCRQREPEWSRRGHQVHQKGQSRSRQKQDSQLQTKGPTSRPGKTEHQKQESGSIVDQNSTAPIWWPGYSTDRKLFSQIEQEPTPKSQGNASLRPKNSKCLSF